MKTTILILIFCIYNCSNPTSNSSELVVHDITINPKLEQDINGYYHLHVNRSMQQTLHTIFLETDYTTSNRVEWTTSSSWVGVYMGVEFDVPIINSVSYTSIDDGSTQTIFAPVVELIGDTVMVCALSEEATSTIEIILE